MLGRVLARPVSGGSTRHDPRMAPGATWRAYRGPAACCACVLVVAASARAATAPSPVVVKDAKDAGQGAPDITRVQLGVTSGGRLRAAVTLSTGWVARNLLAKEGPPGSVCLRLWTVTKPGAGPPDYLVCATSHRDGETMRGTVFKSQPGQELRHVATATVGRTSDRTVTLRFSQSVIAAPHTIRFAAEATKPGCMRVSCVDTAPDAPKTVTFRLRGST
jgi:hypothetical protein